MYVEHLANQSGFIDLGDFSSWCYISYWDKRKKNIRVFTYQQIDEEAYFECAVLKLFIHLPSLDIRDTVNYKEVMKQYPFLSK